MGTINNTAFSSLVSSGLYNYNAIRWAPETVINSTFDSFVDAMSTTGNNGAIPRERTNAQIVGSWTRNGTTAEATTTLTFESDTSQTVEQLESAVELTDGAGFDGFAIWNNGGSGFGQALSNGEDLELVNIPINCAREGIAYALLNGDSNSTDHVYLNDGNGNRFAGSWADKSAPQSFTASDSRFGYNSTVSFTNTTGSSVTVGGVEVVYENNDETILDDQSTFSITLNAGDTLEFTTLEVTLTLP